MLFPFRSSAIFRNRWIALLWAIGICFMATEAVDSISGVAEKPNTPARPDVSAPTEAGPNLRNALTEPDRIVK